MINNAMSPYERLGGERALRQLVDRFYDLMDDQPEAVGIRGLHPQDLSTSRDKLFKFLSGWLGGPPLYVEEYGHPRLRGRHLPFKIGVEERDAWLMCMEQALEQVLAEQGVDDRLLFDYLLQSLRKIADHMRNQ